MTPHLVSLTPTEPFLAFFPAIEKTLRNPSSFDKITATLNANTSSKKSSAEEPNALVAIGDLHGNWLALIQYLLLEKIIDLTPEDFQELAEISNNTYIQQLKNTKTQYNHCDLNIQELSDTINTTLQEIKRLESLFSAEDKAALQAKKNDLMFQEEELAVAKKYERKVGLQFHILTDKVNADGLQFKEILARVKILDTKKIVLLLGDELFDRGRCDWNTKMLITHLRKNRMILRSLLSNHAVEALYNYLTKNWDIDTPPRLMRDDLPQFYDSAINEKVLLDLKLVSQEIIERLTKNWVDTLNLITYSRTESGITIYTHAPVGLETIKALAKKYNINYSDNTIEELCETIDEINYKFHVSLEKNPADPESFVYQFDKEIEVHGKLLEEEGFSYLDICSDDLPILPLLNTLWNRNHDYLVRPVRHRVGGYSLNFSYGHETPQETPAENLLELDNTWGKMYNLCTAYYTFDSFVY